MVDEVVPSANVVPVTLASSTEVTPPRHPDASPTRPHPHEHGRQPLCWPLTTIGW
jgi:hypothetical protein